MGGTRIDEPAARTSGQRSGKGLEVRSDAAGTDGPMRTLRGREALRLLGDGAAARVTTAGPDGFQARLGRIELADLVLELVEAGPHRSDRTEVGTAPPPALTFTLLRAGTLRVTLPGHGFTVRPGESFLLEGRSRSVIEAVEPVRMLRSSLGTRHRLMLLSEGDLPLARPLPATHLTEGFASFVDALLLTADGLQSRKTLTRAVVHLHAGIVEELRPRHEPARAPGELRERMLVHIEAHLSDPALSPVTVAAAMGISLRHAHGVFNVEGRTLARHIRDRRIAGVAAALRDAVGRETLGHLARRHGFVTTDVMTRAFKTVHGLTPSEYRDATRRRAG